MYELHKCSFLSRCQQRHLVTVRATFKEDNDQGAWSHHQKSPISQRPRPWCHL